MKTNYPGTYLHGFDVNNFLSCNNLLTGKKLASRDIYGLDPGIAETHKSIREMSLDDIMNFNFRGVLNPSLLYLLRDKDVAFRKPRGVDVHAKIKRGKIELKFEERRREISPDAASRLNCLYVTTKSAEGEKHIREMFPTRELFVIDVTIQNYFRVTKCDPRWFEEYFRSQSMDVIDNYWNGAAFDSDEMWEYLVEGEIRMSNEKQFEKLRKLALERHSERFGNLLDKLAKWE